MGKKFKLSTPVLVIGAVGVGLGIAYWKKWPPLMKFLKGGMMMTRPLGIPPMGMATPLPMMPIPLPPIPCADGSMSVGGICPQSNLPPASMTACVDGSTPNISTGGLCSNGWYPGATVGPPGSMAPISPATLPITPPIAPTPIPGSVPSTYPCSDGSTPNPYSGLCANGQPPISAPPMYQGYPPPLSPSPYPGLQSPYPGAAGAYPYPQLPGYPTSSYPYPPPQLGPPTLPYGNPYTQSSIYPSGFPGLNPYLTGSRLAAAYDVAVPNLGSSSAPTAAGQQFLADRMLGSTMIYEGGQQESPQTGAISPVFADGNVHPAFDGGEHGFSGGFGDGIARGGGICPDGVTSPDRLGRCGQNTFPFIGEQRPFLSYLSPPPVDQFRNPFLEGPQRFFPRQQLPPAWELNILGQGGQCDCSSPIATRRQREYCGCGTPWQCDCSNPFAAESQREYCGCGRASAETLLLQREGLGFLNPGQGGFGFGQGGFGGFPGSNFDPPAFNHPVDFERDRNFGFNNELGRDIRGNVNRQIENITERFGEGFPFGGHNPFQQRENESNRQRFSGGRNNRSRLATAYAAGDPPGGMMGGMMGMQQQMEPAMQSTNPGGFHPADAGGGAEGGMGMGMHPDPGMRGIHPGDGFGEGFMNRGGGEGQGRLPGEQFPFGRGGNEGRDPVRERPERFNIQNNRIFDSDRNQFLRFDFPTYDYYRRFYPFQMRQFFPELYEEALEQQFGQPFGFGFPQQRPFGFPFGSPQQPFNEFEFGGFDRLGFDREGRDRFGFDRGGFDRDGFDRNKRHRSGRFHFPGITFPAGFGGRHGRSNRFNFSDPHHGRSAGEQHHEGGFGRPQPGMLGHSGQFGHGMPPEHSNFAEAASYPAIENVGVNDPYGYGPGFGARSNLSISNTE